MDHDYFDGLPSQKIRDETKIPEIERVAHLSDLDLERELLDRYYDCRVQLQKLQLNPSADPTQTMNSLMNVMKMIVGMKTELYNAERVKKLEEVVIEVLQEFPVMRDSFLPRYKEKLDEL